MWQSRAVFHLLPWVVLRIGILELNPGVRGVNYLVGGVFCLITGLWTLSQGSRRGGSSLWWSVACGLEQPLSSISFRGC